MGDALVEMKIVTWDKDFQNDSRVSTESYPRVILSATRGKSVSRPCNKVICERSECNVIGDAGDRVAKHFAIKSVNIEVHVARLSDIRN